MRFAVLLLVGGLGCLATASQVMFVSEFLAVFTGNELCLGIILTCWFCGIVAGAYAGGKAATALGKRSLAALYSCATYMVVALPVLVGLLRTWRGMLEVPAGELPGLGALVLSAVALVAPFGALVGFSFPLACSMATSGRANLTIGRVYVIEAVGAIAGGVAVGLVLAGRVPPFVSMGIVSLPLLAGLSWHALTNVRRRVPGILFAASALAVLVLLAGGFAGRLDRHSAGVRFAHLQTGGARVAWAHTPYQHLDLAKQGGQYTLYADSKVCATFPERYAAPLKAHLALTEHPDPRSALLLGNVSLEMLPAMLTHPVVRIDVVELDPGVLELIGPYLPESTRQAMREQRVHLHLTDGRRFLGATDRSWDLIIVDAPDPHNAANNRFYTLEFYRQARARLKPGGVLVTRMSSSAGFLGRETASLVGSVRATLDAVFDHVVVLPGDETFFLASGSDGVLLDSPDALGARWAARGVRDPGFTRHHFKVLFQAGEVADLQQQLSRRSAARINTDGRPVVYLQSILRWSHMSATVIAAPLRLVLSWPGWAWFALVTACALFVFVILRLRRDRSARGSHRAAVAAIGIVGGLGLATELVLTFAYQSTFGRLYSELGLIVATFMAGLVAAGAWMNRRLRTRPGTNRLLGLVLAALAVYSALLPWMLGSWLFEMLSMLAGQVVVLLLVLLAGAGTGLVFPLATCIVVTSGGNMTREAGRLDALDHLGAALGALLTGLALLPVAGRTVTCLLLALITALAAAWNLLVSDPGRGPALPAP